MLLNSLYIINEVSDEKNHPIYATITLNRDHSIFEGHFPGQPIVPGVCLMNMVTDTVSIIKSSPYFLKSSSSIKFINPLDPLLTQKIRIELTVRVEDENGLDADAVLSSNEHVYLKLKGRFEALKNNS